MNAFRFFLTVILLSYGLSACSESSKPVDSQAGSVTKDRKQTVLRQQPDSFLNTVPGRVGFSYVNLKTGEHFAYNGSEHFAMFSTYKLPLVLYVLHLVETGKLSLQQPVTIQSKSFENYSGGEFVRRYRGATITMPVDSLIWYAMAYSDNITTDHLFQLVDGPQTVNDFIHSKSVQDMQIRNTVLEMGREKKYKENYCSPLAMTQLLRLMYEGVIVNEKHRSYLLNYMKLTPGGGRRIKAYLPTDADVAHKTGTGGSANGITDGINDVGFFTLEDGSVVALSVYVNDLQGAVSDGEEVIAQISKMIYDYETLSLPK